MDQQPPPYSWGPTPPHSPGPARVPGAGLWVVALAGLIAMVVVTGAFAAVQVAGGFGDDSPTSFGSAPLGEDPYDSDDGSDDGSYDGTYDGLREGCAEGSMSDCDDLYFQSPIDSDDEDFGSDCGGRADDTSGGCVDLDLDPESLDDLYDGCAAGSYADCDQLWSDTLVGSDYEEFGSTCGGRSAATSGSCE